MGLDNRLALVTGAARSLGATIGRAWRKTARVILADVLVDEARKTADAMEQDGLQVFAEKLDVTDREGMLAFAVRIAQARRRRFWDVEALHKAYDSYEGRRVRARLWPDIYDLDGNLLPPKVKRDKRLS